MLASKRSAMTRRIPLSSMTVSLGPAGVGGMEGTADVAVGVAIAGPGLAVSTSFATILPPGPDPATFASATPRSAAIFRASGELRTRPPAEDAPAGAADPAE